MGKEIKSKLFKLREWLTLPDAARHLSIMFDEKVNETDILRLALDGHLKLSVYFVNHAQARRGDKFLSFDEWEIKFRKMASWKTMKAVATNGMIGFYFPGYDSAFYLKTGLFKNDKRLMRIDKDEELKNTFLNSLSSREQKELLSSLIETAVSKTRKHSEKFEGKVPPSSDCYKGDIVTIEGVWDLPMIGNERPDIEHEYQQLTGGPDVTLSSFDGTFVQGTNGEVFQLQERFNEEEYDQLEQRLIDEGVNIKDRREERKKRPYYDSRNYYPAGALPHDSVFVVRTQALLDLQERLAQQETGKNKPLDLRSERTYLNIIGSLLEVVTGTFKDEKFASETQLRDFLAEKFEGFRGVSTRTLADKFALAKKTINGELD
jgi:hypothetical protein